MNLYIISKILFYMKSAQQTTTTNRNYNTTSGREYDEKKIFIRREGEFVCWCAGVPHQLRLASR